MRRCFTVFIFVTVSEYIIFTYFTFFFYCNQKLFKISLFYKMIYMKMNVYLFGCFIREE